MDFHFDILYGSYRNEEGHRNTTSKRNKNDSAWVHIIKFHWTERSHRKHLSACARQHRQRPIRASLMVMNPESRAWHTQLPLGGVAGDDGIIIFSTLSGTHFLTISRLVCKPVCVIAMYVCLDLVTRCHQAWAQNVSFCFQLNDLWLFSLFHGPSGDRLQWHADDGVAFDPPTVLPCLCHGNHAAPMSDSDGVWDSWFWSLSRCTSVGKRKRKEVGLTRGKQGTGWLYWVVKLRDNHVPPGFRTSVCLLCSMYSGRSDKCLIPSHQEALCGY